MRPQLIPALHKLWRNEQTLQLGVDSDTAVLVTDIDDSSRTLISYLDGSRSEAELAALAANNGSSPAAFKNFLTELHNAGVLTDGELYSRLPTRLSTMGRRLLETELAALSIRKLSHQFGENDPATILAARLNLRVIVHTTGRIGPVVAGILAAAGIGRLHIATNPAANKRVVQVTDICPGGLTTADEGRPYLTAVRDRIRQTAPAINTRALLRTRAHFAILMENDLVNSLLATSYRSNSIPHLPVHIRDGTVIIGPLVIPGVTACLNCVNAHRTDRDPVWPALAAQLATMPAQIEPVSVSTAIAAAAICSAQTLAFLDGHDPETLGASLEISDPPGTIHRREWSTHPNCDCALQYPTTQPEQIVSEGQCLT